MIEVRQTDLFANWLRKLRDEQARARVQIRIRRLSLGNLGDVKPVGEGVSELRIDYGPGYRVYFRQIGTVLILLLVGGTKRTQDEDIAKAKKLAKEAHHGA
jgi:putative addiction module killer protein